MTHKRTQSAIWRDIQAVQKRADKTHHMAGRHVDEVGTWVAYLDVITFWSTLAAEKGQLAALWSELRMAAYRSNNADSWPIEAAWHARMRFEHDAEEAWTKHGETVKRFDLLVTLEFGPEQGPDPVPAADREDSRLVANPPVFLTTNEEATGGAVPDRDRGPLGGPR